jgi:hypothetical protein
VGQTTGVQPLQIVLRNVADRRIEGGVERVVLNDLELVLDRVGADDRDSDPVVRPVPRQNGRMTIELPVCYDWLIGPQARRL